jgi:hypothetical protein
MCLIFTITAIALTTIGYAAAGPLGAFIGFCVTILLFK